MKMAQPIGIIDHAAGKRYVVRSCADMTEICGVTKNWANEKMNVHDSYDFISKKSGKLFTLVRLPKEDFKGPMSKESEEFVGGGKQGKNDILNRPLNPVTWHKESVCWNCCKSSNYRLCSWVTSKHRIEDVPDGCKTATMPRSNHSDLRQPDESIVIVSCPNHEPGQVIGNYDIEACGKLVYAMCEDTSRHLKTIAAAASKSKRNGYNDDYKSHISTLKFYGKFYQGSELGEAFLDKLRRDYQIDF